jgi:hypothetical protein
MHQVMRWGRLVIVKQFVSLRDGGGLATFKAIMYWGMGGGWGSGELGFLLVMCLVSLRL